MTMLKDRMMQDLKLAGHAPKTQKTYVECTGHFARFCWSPEPADQAVVRAWVEKLQKSQVGSQRLRQHFAALKFLYGMTLARPEQVAFLSWPKDPKRLPQVLTEEQVGKLLEALESPKYRVFFTTLYATGLRLREASHLETRDIDAARGVIHVRQGKGNRERLMLSPRLLVILPLEPHSARGPPGSGGDVSLIATAERRLRGARSCLDLRRLRRRTFLPPIVTVGAPPVVSRPHNTAELSSITLSAEPSANASGGLPRRRSMHS